jgi:hypothetical protein
MSCRPSIGVRASVAGGTSSNPGSALSRRACARCHLAARLTPFHAFPPVTPRTATSSLATIGEPLERRLLKSGSACVVGSGGVSQAFEYALAIFRGQVTEQC